MKNRTYMRFFILLILLVSSCGVYALQITAGPCLQNATETSVTILWITDANCTSWVEYGTDSSLGQRAIYSQYGLTDANWKIHRITLNRLSAGTTYYYKVCSKEIVKFAPYKVTFGSTATAGVYHFTTLDSKKRSASFIIFNDIHENTKMLREMLKKAEDRPYDLVFLNGDMVKHIDSREEISKHIIQPCTEAFAKNIPLVYVRGNHETRGEFARQLPEYFILPDKRYYGSFDHGPVHFVVVDSGEDKDGSHGEYSGLTDFVPYRKEQQQWLEKEIQSEAFQKASFRVVLVHIPIAAGPTVEFTKSAYSELWGPLFEKGKIDAMICGHTHIPEIVRAASADRSYPIIIGGGPLKSEKPRPENYTTIRVDAEPNALEITITGFDGKIIDSCTVKKNDHNTKGVVR